MSFWGWGWDAEVTVRGCRAKRDRKRLGPRVEEVEEDVEGEWRQMEVEGRDIHLLIPLRKQLVDPPTNILNATSVILG